MHADLRREADHRAERQAEPQSRRASRRAATRSTATGETLEKMIREDLVAERIAIATYSEIVRWLGNDDPTTRRMMEELLAKEEEHADDMAKLLGSRAASAPVTVTECVI